MLKKYFKRYVVISLILSCVFVLSSLVVFPVKAQSMTISQLIELLITIGVIAPDKAVAARTVATDLASTTTATTTITTPVNTNIISTTTSYIQVFYPNGAENWKIDLDLPYTIRWGSVGLTQVNVALVSSNAKTSICNLTPGPITTKSGDREFSVLLKTAKCYNQTTGTSTPLTDGSYKARVYFTDIKGNTLKDESNAVFKILPVPIPSMKLAYPNGDEQLTRNTEYIVKYTLTNVDRIEDSLIYYYLLDNNGNIADNGHKLVTSGRTFDYKLPSSLSAGAYKMKLKLNTDEHVLLEDVSDNFFWISTGL